MSNFLTEPTREPEHEMTSIAVGVPGIFGNPDNYLSLVSLPAGMDLAEQWQAYNACAGKIYKQNGESLDHQTVMFDEWLVHQNHRQGAFLETTTTLLPGFDPAALVDATLNPEIPSYVPDFSELNPNLTFSGPLRVIDLGSSDLRA